MAASPQACAKTALASRVMLAAEIRLRDDLPMAEGCEPINRLEARLRERFSEIGRSFVEPDVRH